MAKVEINLTLKPDLEAARKKSDREPTIRLCTSNFRSRQMMVRSESTLESNKLETSITGYAPGLFSRTFERLEQAPRERDLSFPLTTWRVMLTAIKGEAVVDDVVRAFNTA